MRREPSSKSEVVSQMLFGETCIIVGESEERGYWAVVTEFDDYTNSEESKKDGEHGRGFFVDKKQLHLLNQPDDTLVGHPRREAVALEFQCEARNKNRFVRVPFGSTLHGFQDGRFRLRGEEMDYAGRVFLPAIVGGTAHSLESLSRQLLGIPYFWGGRSIMGMDCSGLVQVLFKALGVSLPRDARDQATHGEPASYRDGREGDLVFFHDNSAPNKIIHVGVRLSDRQIIHAHGHVRIDRITEEGILNVDSQRLTHFFHSIRRMDAAK